MRLAGIIENDIANGIGGISTSIWLQGCPHKCEGCHNPNTWDIDGGKYIELDDCINILKSIIPKDNIMRNLSILGGEPLSDENCIYTKQISERIKQKFPNIYVIVWTGYTLKELKESNKLIYIDSIDYLIDGRFDKKLYDPSLPLRGSTNQQIYKCGTNIFKKRIFKNITNIMH